MNCDDHAVISYHHSCTVPCLWLCCSCTCKECRQVFMLYRRQAAKGQRKECNEKSCVEATRLFTWCLETSLK